MKLIINLKIMNKTILFIILLILAVLVIAGGIYLLINQPDLAVNDDQNDQQDKLINNQSESDPILELINQVEATSKVKFSDPKPITFDWRYKIEDQIDKIEVVGLEFIISSASTKNYQAIEEYFRNNLEPDISNMASGVMGNLEGYWNNNDVCLLEYKFINSSKSKQGPIVPDTSTRDIFLRCGFLDKTNLSKIFYTNKLQGKWVSVDDEDSIIEFKQDKKIDYYAKQLMSENIFEILNNNNLIVGENENKLEYEIVKITSDSLILTYLARGNTLEYKKINE